VVFFGESVPPEKVVRAMGEVDGADALLVVGSSLTGWSGFRLARRPADRGLPIAIVNIGTTRGDDLATIKLEANCGDVLDALLDDRQRRASEASCHPERSEGPPSD